MIYCENCYGKEFSFEEHREFILNEDNIQNCENCPENRKMDNHYCNGNHPCGQPRCWVELQTSPSPYHKNPLDDEWEDDDDDYEETAYDRHIRLFEEGRE